MFAPFAAGRETGRLRKLQQRCRKWHSASPFRPFPSIQFAVRGRKRRKSPHQWLTFSSKSGEGELVKTFFQRSKDVAYCRRSPIALLCRSLFASLEPATRFREPGKSPQRLINCT